MAAFNQFTPVLQATEGHYQDSIPNDKGNLNSSGEAVGTSYGISAQVYEQYIGHPPTKEEMQSMSRDTAHQIIEQHYWQGMVRGDEIQDQYTANNIADMTVNTEKHGIALVQEKLWELGQRVDLQKEHTTLSDKDIQALNGMDPDSRGIFNNAYSNGRLDYYEHLPAAFDASRHGLENRVVEHFPEERDVAGWQETKQEGYYVNTMNIQQVLFHGDPHQVDGKAGPGTQAALQQWQEAHGLQPTGYLDRETKDLLYTAIMQDETAHAWGDANRDIGAIRDARLEQREFNLNPVQDDRQALMGHGLWGTPGQEGGANTHSWGHLGNGSQHGAGAADNEGGGDKGGIAAAGAAAGTGHAGNITGHEGNSGAGAGHEGAGAGAGHEGTAGTGAGHEGAGAAAVGAGHSGNAFSGAGHSDAGHGVGAGAFAGSHEGGQSSSHAGSHSGGHTSDPGVGASHGAGVGGGI